MMKRTLCLLFAAVLLGLSLSACSNNVFIKSYGASELYSKHDMNAAVNELMRRFNRWEDKCRMIEVKYAGDDISLEKI